MTSPDKPTEQRIEQRARAVFLRASEDLDPAIARRLRTARREAMQVRRASPLTARLLLPAGAFAVIALATLMVWQPRHENRVVPAPATAASGAGTDDNELPPDADSADPGLYQNLDFYGWLAANDGARTARKKP